MLFSYFSIFAQRNKINRYMKNVAHLLAEKLLKSTH